MATAAMPTTGYNITTRIDSEVDDRHGWGYVLLLLTTVTLFLRPADLLPALEKWPIYQILIVACIVVSSRTLVRQLRHSQLARSPVTTCLLVLLVAIGVSHLSHGFTWAARASVFEFSKLFAFYLLMIGLINTPRRLLVFAKILALTITSVSALALLDRYNLFSIAAFASIRDRVANDPESIEMIERLRGTGIFQDPNDFGLVLVVGSVLCFAFLSRPGAGWRRYVWLIPISILITGFSLTHSRGAMLSLACVLPAVLAYRSGAKVAVASLMTLPILAMGFSGRMSDLSAMDSGTGQSRIQIWSESLSLWRANPLFGLGEGMLVEEIQVVSHNSFVHCYAELGFLGGTAFLASFLVAGLALWSSKPTTGDGEALAPLGNEMKNLAHLQMFAFAMVAAYVAGILTLSRQWITPTYLVLGFATAAQNVGVKGRQPWRVNNRFIAVSLLSSLGFLAVMYVLIRIMVRW